MTYDHLWVWERLLWKILLWYWLAYSGFSFLSTHHPIIFFSWQHCNQLGHSMGTTCFMILSSYKPRLVSQVDLAILLAPVVEPHHMTNFIWYIAPLQKMAKMVMEFLGILEILPASLLIEKLTWDHIGKFLKQMIVSNQPTLSYFHGRPHPIKTI